MHSGGTEGGCRRCRTQSEVMLRWDTRLTPPTPGVAPISAGIGPGDLTRAQLRGHQWRRSSRGLYVPAEVELTPSQRLAEAAARLPRCGGLGGWAAAYWIGVRLLDGGMTGGRLPVLLCLGSMAKIRPSPGVVVSRARLDPDDITELRGLRITSPVRTAFDGARLAPSLIEAVAFLDMMLAARLLTEADFAAYLATHGTGWTGTAQARNALRLADRESRSPQETRLRMLWIIDAQLPRPLVNRAVFTLDGMLLGIPDLLDLDAGTVAEYDGRQHRDLDQHTRDNSREESFEEAGLVVTRITSLDMSHRTETTERLARGWWRGEKRDRTQDNWTVAPPPWYRRPMT